MGAEMAYEEKRAWIMLVVTVGVYEAYLIIILVRADGVPLAEVPYVSTLLWTIGAAVVASIVLHMVVAMASPKDAGKADQRDPEIDRFGEYAGQWFVIAGGVAALVLSLFEVDHFWIANAIYLAFVLSAILASAAKIVAYRRGFRPW
jgi:cobalamin synthase